MKSKRNHKKRHGVGREKSLHARRRHRHAALSQQAAHRRKSTRLAAARLYWRGVVEDFDAANARCA